MLSIFEAAAVGNVYSAAASDFTQMQIKYEGVTQWTYGKIVNEWYLGYISQNIKVLQVEQYQQFVVNGYGQTKNTFQHPNKTIKSPYFDSPWSVAYQHVYYPVLDWVTYKVNGSTWSF